MKHLKILAFAAMACAALMAFASTASATTLDIAGGGTVKTGTTIHAEAAEAVLEDTFGFVENVCESTTQGKTTNETGATVNGNVEKSGLTWSNCSFPTSTVKGGTLSIKWTSGNNGSVSGSGFEVTTEIPTGVCIYGTGEGLTLGSLDGAKAAGEKAKLTINTVVKLLKTESGFCTSSARWTATYVVDNPVGLTAKS